MSKKSRKQRKLNRNDKRGTSAHAPSERPSETVVVATAPPEQTEQTEQTALAAQVVAEVVQQIAAAVEEIVDDHDNRRKHPRVALAVEIDLSSESHFFSGLSGDLSEGGVFVETYRDIPVGSEVALEFDLPNGSVTAHGSVKWHRDHSDSSPPGVGVAFDDLSDEGKELIVAFCARRAPLYYDVASP